MFPPPPPNGFDTVAGLDPRLVDALTELDEQLRSGRVEIDSLPEFPDSELAASGEALRACLMELEAAWPRLSKRGQNVSAPEATA